MDHCRKLIPRSARRLALAFVVLALAPSAARAQYGGYGGYGYGGYGYGGYGFGNTYNPYVSPFYAVGPSVPGYGYGLGTMSPLYGAGLTPLGVESALIETAIIRGSGGYRLRYPAAAAPPGLYGVYGR